MELRLLLGTESGLWGQALALALTYLAHSALWAAAVALLARSRTLSSATRHACWKAALFGPLLSACLATSASCGFAYRLVDGSTWRAPPAAASGADTLAPHAASAGSTLEQSVLQHLPTGRAWVLVGLLAMGVGLLRFGGSVYLLHRRLRDRAPVVDALTRQRFARLCARMHVGPVKLTQSDSLSSPLVLGVREVCVPRQLFAELAPAELDAALAHELAHVERRDGLWFPLVGALQSALWLQPLNHLVSSHFRDSAELACDDRAVEVTGSALGLARALLHVAERASHAQAPLFVPTMARHRSALVPRVQRLTEAQATSAPKRKPEGRWPAALKLVVVGAALATLSVRVAGAIPQTPRTALSSRVASKVTSGAATGVLAHSDLSEQNAKMTELAQQAQQLEAALAAAEAKPRAALEGSPEAVRVLELSQELRHVRETQAWLEERFVSEWAALEARKTAQR